MPIDLSQLIESVRGLAGSGNVLGQSLKGMDRSLRTMEPGDLVQSNPARYTASPIAYDLWYLWYNANLMARYYPTAGADGAPFDGKHFDYTDYIEGNLGFLSYLPGLKTLKVFCDVKAQLANNTYFSVESMTIKTDWTNNGVNWINLMVFELWTPGNGAQFPSDGPKGFNINDYVGYFTFPIGQLGVMETISLIQETGLFGYSFHAVDGTEHYLDKSPVVLEDSQKPTVQGTPGMFPDAKDVNGNQLSGMNYCYGRHLIESAYVVPTVPTPSQNSNNSKGETAYAPTPKKDVELFSSPMKQYPEEVSPKLWMRYWIHKDSTLPVPGEFLGVLCRSVATPQHVWWFQGSNPFLYAGNWVETKHLTSGVILSVTDENARTDGGIGTLYNIQIQGSEVLVNSSDFLKYAVDDRVAVLIVNSVSVPATKSFSWLDQPVLKQATELTRMTNYVIIPATFYKRKH